MSCPFPPEPYTGPVTGEVLDARELARVELAALRHSASRATQPLPVLGRAGSREAAAGA